MKESLLGVVAGSTELGFLAFVGFREVLLEFTPKGLPPSSSVVLFFVLFVSGFSLFFNICEFVVFLLIITWGNAPPMQVYKLAITLWNPGFARMGAK